MRWTEHTTKKKEPNTVSIPALPPQTWWAIAGSAAIVLGTLLPWATVALLGSISGIDADRGLLTLVCGAICLGVLLFARDSAFAAGLVFAGIALAVCVWFIADLSSSTKSLFGEDVQIARVGAGVWVSAAGSLATIVALISGRRFGAV